MPLYAPPVVVEGRAKNADATIYYSIPGNQAATVATSAITANVVRYAPFLVKTPITLDQLSIEVTAAGAASTTARLGIYNADTDWQPTSLVVDAGTVAVDSTGVKTASISQSLSPGRYLLAFNSDGAPTVRIVRGGAHLLGYDPALNTTPFVTNIRVTQAYAVFPSPGTAWTTITAGATPNITSIFVRISVP